MSTKSEKLITISVSDLVFAHGEIGVHRGRKYGFRDVFGFQTLHNTPFKRLAKRVKAAYQNKEVPSHKGWPKQRETLAWFIERGPEAMYQFNDDIRVYSEGDGIYAIAEGNHRALALYVMGVDHIRAKVIPRKTFVCRRCF